MAQGLLYAGFVWAMWLVGGRAGLGIFYYVALAVAIVLVLRQFWIARDRARGNCFEAFISNQWVGLAIFAGIAGHYALG